MVHNARSGAARDRLARDVLSARGTAEALRAGMGDECQRRDRVDAACAAAAEDVGLVVVGRGCFVAVPTEWLLAMT